MSDNGNGAATVGRNGVTVYQSYQEERFDVPAILLEFVSERDSPVDVRASVSLPSGLRAGTVGFHPEYGREHWSVEGDSLVFETAIEPGETVATVYAVESLRADQLDALFDSLTLDRVSAGTDPRGTDSGFDVHPSRRSDRGDDETTPPGEDDDAVGDVTAQVETHTSGSDEDQIEFASVSDGGETADSGDDQAERRADTDDAPETRDAEPPTADGSARGSDDPLATDPDDETAPGPAESGDVSDLLESGAVSDRLGSGVDSGHGDDGSDGDHRSGHGERDPNAGEGPGLRDYPTTDLIDELDSRAGESQLTSGERERLYSLLLSEGDATSDRMRLLHLQAQVTHLEQGMESVREFDDRHGRPAEAFADLEAELAALQDGLASVESEVSRLAERQETVESEVSSLVDWRESFQQALGSLGED